VRTRFGGHTLNTQRSIAFELLLDGKADADHATCHAMYGTWSSGDG